MEEILNKIRARQMDVVRQITNGVPGSYEQYRLLVGHHQGLQEALHIIEKALDEQDNRDL